MTPTQESTSGDNRDGIDILARIFAGAAGGLLLVGKLEQTIMVYSENLTAQNKEDIKECKKIGFEVHSIKEFSDDMCLLLDSIEQSSEFYSPDEQGKVKKAISSYKDKMK